MKKIGKYLLTLVFGLSSVFAVVGCGSEEPKDDPSAINNEDWKNTFDMNVFSAKTLVDVTPDDDVANSGYEISYYQSNYEIKYINMFPSNNNDDGRILNVSYLNGGSEKFTYKYSASTSSWNWEHELGVQTEYDANIKDIRDLIWYVNQNQAKFTKDKGYSSYTLNITDNRVKELVSGVKEVMGATAFNIDVIFVTSDTIYLNSSSGQTIIFITFDNISAVDYLVSLKIDNFTSSYTLVNDSDDVNQIRLEVTPTGFHVITLDDEEYLKDNGDGIYVAYIKEGNTFTKNDNINKTAYETEYKNFVASHTFDFASLQTSDFKIVDGKYVSNEKIDLTDTGTKYEYHFSNIVIDLEREQITWDYLVHDKSLNLDSPTYKIVLSILREGISYPTVE